MAMIDDFRSLIHDNSVNGDTHFTDAELTVILETALIEVNIWARTEYVDIAALELARSTSPSVLTNQVYLCTLYTAQILCMKSDASAFDLYTRTVTQDTDIDPGDSASRIKWILADLERQLEKRLNNWFGIMDGGLVWRNELTTEF